MRRVTIGAALLLSVFGPPEGGRHMAAQSLSYSRGQNVSPAYEGWEEAADGTRYFIFGYMNRNWEEQIDVPVLGLSGSAVSNAGSRRDTAAAATPNPENPIRANRAMLPPARVTVGKNVGLHVTWFVYRGAGKVTFSPEQIMSWEDTRTGANSPWAPVWTPSEMPADGNVSVQVTFHEPGVYVIRSRADDGALTTDGQVTITVTR